MKKKPGRFSGNSILRLVLVGAALLIQLLWLLVLVLRLNEYSVLISAVTGLLTVVAVLKLNARHTTSAMKMPWIILILIFPVMGLSLYLISVFFAWLGSRGRKARFPAPVLAGKENDTAQLAEEDPAAGGISRYLSRYAASPLYRDTKVRYFSHGSQALESMKEALEAAKTFIFMEYFIISDSSAFREIREILVRKAEEGVEVRLMYDDIGSVGYVNLRYARELNRQGIRCRVFNPALPVLNLFMNHRDHRKITVVDGKVGFVGGFNLSDEYFGRSFPFGLWKDTGIRLEGGAVKSLTAAFLDMWNRGKEEENTDRFLAGSFAQAQEGFVQPYQDNPLDNERVAENVYLNLIGAARESLYFMTPYLIITDEMTSALTLAAKRGVDVRIITPGIPDKKIVYGITRSYYPQLASQGVRIFEYSPGFVHAKQCLCDGKMASIGTSNLDFRSLYLHFENDVFLFGGEAVRDMQKDFAQMFPQCREVTDLYGGKQPPAMRLGQYFLRLFSPLL